MYKLSVSIAEWVCEVALDNSNTVVRKLHMYAHRTTCRGSRTWIDNTRLFLQPPTTTRMPISVAVRQIVLFTMLQSFPSIPEE